MPVNTCTAGLPSGYGRNEPGVQMIFHCWFDYRLVPCHEPSSAGCRDAARVAPAQAGVPPRGLCLWVEAGVPARGLAWWCGAGSPPRGLAWWGGASAPPAGCCARGGLLRRHQALLPTLPNSTTPERGDIPRRPGPRVHSASAMCRSVVKPRRRGAGCSSRTCSRSPQPIRDRG